MPTNLNGCMGDCPNADWKLLNQTIDKNDDQQPQCIGNYHNTIAVSKRTNNRRKTSNFTSIVLLVVMGCFHAQGFSSFQILSEKKRFETFQRQRYFQTTKPQLFSHNNRQRRSVVGVALCSKPPASVEEATISLDWTEYFAPKIDNGETSETPVLFLHGLLGNKRNFATCANMLANQVDKKRRILGVDLRNHGSTQPWSEESK